MRKRGLLVFLAVCSLASGIVRAQQHDRWEFAIHLPVIQLKDFRTTEPGVGLQAGFHVKEWSRVRFTLDGQTDYFPGIHSYGREQRRFAYWRAAEEVSKAQLMLGLRAGTLWRGTESFGRVRPGLFRFSDFTLYREDAVCPQVWPIPGGCFSNRSKIRPTIDIGGGLVLKAGDRWFVRLDAGDNMVHYDLDLLTVPYIGPPVDQQWRVNVRPAPPSGGNGADWRHHFHVGAGFGYRFLTLTLPSPKHSKGRRLDGLSHFRLAPIKPK